MPHYLVLQPNKKIAIWSTIVDSFLYLNLEREDAIEVEKRDCHLRGVQGYTTLLERELRNIDEVGIAWDWADDWNDCVRFLESIKSLNLKKIDDAGLPRRMKRTKSKAEQYEYFCGYWRSRCQMAEIERDRAVQALRMIDFQRPCKKRETGIES